MKDPLINRTLQPPDKIVSDDCDENVIDHILGWVKKNYTAADLFDLYEHDKEVIGKFLQWRGSAYKHVPFEQVWEIYCNQPENK